MIFFHIDIDAFYASVEQSDKPSIRGKPVIIGALPGRRGVVAACSYEARKFGIHSAMPISQASRLCPNGVFLPVRMARYQEISSEIMDTLRAYTPEIRQISIDEASLNMTGTQRLFGNPEKTASMIKQQIRDTFSITVSIGIAGNRYLAKLASEAEKPDGLCMIREGEETGFLNRLDLKDLWGVGKEGVLRMKETGIMSIAQLRSYPLQTLIRLFGKGAGTYYYDTARGIDPGIYHEEVKNRSISNETTLNEDSRDQETIRRIILDLSHQVVFRLMKEHYSGKTVFIKLRFSDFSTTTAQKTLQKPLGSAEELFQHARELLCRRWDGKDAIRLIGVGISSLKKGEPDQFELFVDQNDRKKLVESAVLQIRGKGNKLVKASLLKEDRDLY